MSSANPSARVSIGVPVYNGERFLEETLDALLAQSYRDIEILIADNASTDSTAGICAKYAAMDPRVRYFRNPVNLGSAGNVRRVGELARAEYFKLANADDVPLPNLVESCIAVLDRDPEVVLCCGRSRLIDANSVPIRDYHDDVHTRSLSAVERFRHMASRVRLTNALQGVIRTTAVKKLFPHYGSYDGADVVILAALALYGQIHQLPDVLFLRRMHEWSSSALTEHERKQAYLDPAEVHSLPAYLLKIHRGYVQEILSAPLAASVKARLLWVVLRSLGMQRNSVAHEAAGLLRRLWSARPPA